MISIQGKIVYIANLNPKWIDINVFCIVSMSAVLIVSLCPADKESFSDLLQIWSSEAENVKREIQY